MAEAIEINPDKLDADKIKAINDAIGKLDARLKVVAQAAIRAEKIDSDVAKAKAQVQSLLALNDLKNDLGPEFKKTFKSPEGPKPPEPPKPEAPIPSTPTLIAPAPSSGPRLSIAEGTFVGDGLKAVGAAATATGVTAAGYGLYNAFTNPAGYAAGAVEGLKLFASHAASVGSSIYSGLSNFTKFFGLGTGAINATIPGLASLPFFTAPALAGAAALTGAGFLLRGVRRLAFGKQTTRPKWYNLPGHMIAPFKELYELGKDIKEVVTGSVHGPIGTVWKYTGEPVRQFAGNTLVPAKGMKNWLWAGGAATAGFLLGGPVGAALAYGATNYWRHSGGTIPGSGGGSPPAVAGAHS